MSTISASTTTTTAFGVTADTTGALVFQTGASPTTALTLSSAQLMTLPNDASISGLTVGKGGGSVSTNTAVGASALNANSAGANDTAIGYRALYLNTGGNNTAIGSYAAFNNAGGANVVAVGREALYGNTSGNYNVAVGDNALSSNTTASNNTAVGYQALYTSTTATNNTAVGYTALKLNTSGDGNAAFGFQALQSNTTGYANTAIGGQYVGVASPCMNNNTTGSFNTALGASALASNTTSSFNTALGYQAGYSTSTTGGHNTFVGYQSGYTNTTADRSVYLGDNTGYAATGRGNTYIGCDAGYVMTSGASNTILGRFSGNQGSLDIRTSSNNIVLSDGDGNPRLYCNSNGRWSMNGGTSALTPVLQIYSTTQDADVQMGSTQNGNDIHLYLVNSTRTSMLSQTSNNLVAQCGSNGVYLSNGATSWAAYSDSRLKDVTGTYTNALADIAQLEPVKFTWKSDEDKKPCVGLIAQSVEKVVPEAIDKAKKPDYKETGDDTEYLSVRYSELVPLLTAAVQELKAELDTVKAELAALRG